MTPMTMRMIPRPVPRDSESAPRPGTNAVIVTIAAIPDTHVVVKIALFTRGRAENSIRITATIGIGLAAIPTAYVNEPVSASPIRSESARDPRLRHGSGRRCDSVQVASACRAGTATTLVTSDLRRAQAARSVDLDVVGA